MYSYVNKTAYNKKWILVFHHEVNKTDGLPLFNSFEQVKHFNETERYSILGDIDRFKYNGKFEFLLEYPNLEGCNIWTQTVSPIDAQHGQDIGYKEVNITWRNNYFGGIARAYSNHTFLDGSPTKTDYYYAIGLKDPWKQYHTIPGPHDISVYPYTDEKYHVFEVNLWLRIDPDITINNNKLIHFNIGILSAISLHSS